MQRMSLGGLSLALAGILSCSDASGPYDDVVLRIDPIDQVVTPTSPAPSVTIYLHNTGTRDVHVRLCNAPPPNQPGAALVLQQQQPDSSWAIVSPWVTCLDPTDGFDAVVKEGDELQIGRLFAANVTGRYRYQLTFLASGRTGSVLSAPYTVTYQ